MAAPPALCPMRASSAPCGQAVVVDGLGQRAAVGAAVQHGAAEGAEQVLGRVAVGPSRPHAGRLDDVAHHSVGARHALDERSARRYRLTAMLRRKPSSEPCGLSRADSAADRSIRRAAPSPVSRTATTLLLMPVIGSAVA